MKTTAFCLLVIAIALGTVAAEEGNEQEVCVVETSLGTMVFRFFDDEAPRTSAQIKGLVREGFYDGLPFYRVVAGHVIQAGDGGDSGRPTVPGEFDAHPHVPGAVGLARSADPDSGSTEFYVCHAARPHLLELGGSRAGRAARPLAAAARRAETSTA